jgi:hypothetical protein
VDPLAPAYPWYTPYQFAGNTPIQAVDIDGKEPLEYMALFAATVWYTKLKSGTADIIQAAANTGSYNNASIPKDIQNLQRLSQAARGATAINEVANDVGHGALDAAGMVPIVGEVFDGINAVWYYKQRNYVLAGAGVLGMMPLLGNFSTAGKTAVKGTNFVREIEEMSDDYVYAIFKADNVDAPLEFLAKREA